MLLARCSEFDQMTMDFEVMMKKRFPDVLAEREREGMKARSEMRRITRMLRRYIEKRNRQTESKIKKTQQHRAYIQGGELDLEEEGTWWRHDCGAA